MRPVCAVSIDLDPIPCYYRIHALGEPPPELRNAIMRACVPRFAEVLDARGIAATFFVVGEDFAADPGSRDLMRQLAASGHELANHSYSHWYDLARRPPAEVRDEIRRAHDSISQVAGAPVIGFRAPGYDVSPAMVETLLELGYQYDSSVFPAPGYYALKAAIMGAMAVLGRDSGAVLTNPRALLAPADPYRPDAARPWRRGDAALVEVPIGVTPVGRTPAIGTNLLLAPGWLRRRWLRAMARRPVFNFELHGIDLCDATIDRMPAELVARQPDLRATVARKQAAFEEVLDALAVTHEFATLREVGARAAHDLRG